jgi:DNA-binding CsgD family transcriptional regulator
MWELTALFILDCIFWNAYLVFSQIFPLKTVIVAIMISVIPLFALLLLFAQKRFEIDREPKAPNLKRGIGLTKTLLLNRKSMQFQLILLIAVSITETTMRVAGNGVHWSDFRVSELLIADAAVLVIAILAYILIGIGLYYHFTHGKTSGFWLQLPFLTLLVGVLILQFLRNDFSDSFVFLAFVLTLEGLSQLVFCMTMMSIVRALPLSTFRIVGFATFLTSVMPLFDNFIIGKSSAINALILGIAYLVALSVIFIVRDKSNEVAGETVGDNQEVSDDQIVLSLEDRIEALAKARGLTGRETEVFTLLVKGLSLPAIQDELYIAGGTARTHIKHIYEKLEVHTRQEMMGLFL